MPDRTPGRSEESGDQLASYRTLLEVARMLLGTATIDELLSRITRELKRLVPYDVVTVYEIDHAQGLFRPLLVVDSDEGQLYDSPFPVDAGLTGGAVATRRPVNYPRADLIGHGDLVPGTENEPEALAIVPLMARDEPIATLNVSRLGEDVAFSAAEFDLICRFADLAALGLDNARVHEQLTHEAQTDSLTNLGNHRSFQERLRDEVDRAHRYGRELSLIVFDLDDFKRLNDLHGHLEGDAALIGVGLAARACLRANDTAYRIGGEEFAILLPETAEADAVRVAERLCAGVRALQGVRAVTVSCGVSGYPLDASGPIGLHEAADDALYFAKAHGKNRVIEFSDDVRKRRQSQIEQGRDDQGPLPQLELLHALAGKLGRLGDAARIGEAIVRELRSLIDYDTARVYVLEGSMLEPVSFGGKLGAYEDMDLETLRCALGEGITGSAALRGQTLNVADANDCEFAEDIEGTDELEEESILVVPLRLESRTTGAIVLSKERVNGFDTMAERLLELFAAQAAVAFENTRLLHSERRAAEISRALLDLSLRITGANGVHSVADDVVRVVLRLSEAQAAAVVGRDPDTGRARVIAAHGDPGIRQLALAAEHAGHPRGEGIAVLRTSELSELTQDAAERAALAAVAPLADGLLVVVHDSFSPTTLEAIMAVAGQASLALRQTPPSGDAQSQTGS